jgi:hypothetical protein
MAKMTLLEMVQDIMNDMDSDVVNSISDTPESVQVAQIVKTSYFKLVSSRDDWPFLRTLTSLTGLADVSNPTKMQIPDTVNAVLWIKYNKKDVTYLDPHEFKYLLDNRTVQASVVDSNGFILNRDPLYWTTYDDQYVIFDSIDLSSDSTLQSSKCAAYCQVAASWTHSDSFIPTLPEKMFPTLLADAKGTAFLGLKQQANPKEEAYAKNGRTRFQNTGIKARDGQPRTDSNINYGRR